MKHASCRLRSAQLLSTKGFTIVELLAVMFVILVLMGMGIAWASRFYSQRRVGAAAGEVAAGLRQARNLAMARNRVVHVRFVHESEDLQQVMIYILPDATLNLGRVSAWPVDGDEVAPSVILPRGVRLDPDGDPTGDPTSDYTKTAGVRQIGSIYFWPDGSAGEAVDVAEASPFPLSLADDEANQRLLTVDLATGHVDVTNPEVDP